MIRKLRFIALDLYFQLGRYTILDVSDYITRLYNNRNKNVYLCYVHENQVGVVTTRNFALEFIKWNHFTKNIFNVFYLDNILINSEDSE